MPKLKSLFGGNQKKEESERGTITGEGMVKNRSPGVVARLMGLEMLPAADSRTKPPDKKVLLEKRVPDSNTLVDITVSGKQLNGVTGRSSRNSKSKSFDDGKQLSFDRRDDLQVRVTPGEAECLQSIELEELNKQLMARHMQVLDELNEAKQQLRHDRIGGGKKISKSLSDSTEFLDAVELLEVNKQFFEKYFQSTGALQNVLKRIEPVGQKQGKRENKLKTANRIPQYLSGHSSPRPASRADLEQQNAELKRDDKKGSSIVVLKPRKSVGGKKLELLKSSKPEEKTTTTTKDNTKDIAKLIAKKIKESIAKEVAKTFYLTVDSAVSPQRGAPGKPDSDRRKQPNSTCVPGSEIRGKKANVKPRQDSNDTKKSLSPKVNRACGASTRQPAKSTSAVSEEGLKMDCSRNARVAKSQKASSEKKFDEPKSSSPRLLNRTRAPDASPRIASDSPRAVRQKSASSVSSKVLKDTTSSIKNTKRTTASVSVKSIGLSNEAADDEVDNTQVCLSDATDSHERLSTTEHISTPTKTESSVDINILAENKSSPVSVLESIDEDGDDEDDEYDDLIVKPVQLGDIDSRDESTELQQVHIVQVRDVLEAVNETSSSGQLFSSQELVCRQEDLEYLKKLVTASTQNGIFQTALVLDPQLFQSLEDDYNQKSSEELFSDPVKVQLGAFNRWLIFDFVNEFLSRQTWKQMNRLKTGEEVLKELWMNIREHSRLQSSQQSLEALVDLEFRKDRNGDWDESQQIGSSEFLQQIEIALFNSLVEEAIADILA